MSKQNHIQAGLAESKHFIVAALASQPPSTSEARRSTNGQPAAASGTNNALIAFPYKTPLAAQQAVIRRSVQVFHTSEHALLESPTGTGKTLALLCTALGYQHRSTAQASIGRLQEAQRQCNARVNDLLASNALACHVASVGRPSPAPAPAPAPLAASAPRTATTAAAAAATKQGPPPGLWHDGTPVFPPSSSPYRAHAGYTGAVAQAVRKAWRETTVSKALEAGKGGARTDAGGSRAVGGQRADGGLLCAPPLPASACPRILYGSRTHSQLAQVGGELSKCGFYTHGTGWAAKGLAHAREAGLLQRMQEESGLTLQPQPQARAQAMLAGEANATVGLPLHLLTAVEVAAIPAGRDAAEVYPWLPVAALYLSPPPPSAQQAGPCAPSSAGNNGCTPVPARARDALPPELRVRPSFCLTTLASREHTCIHPAVNPRLAASVGVAYRAPRPPTPAPPPVPPQSQAAGGAGAVAGGSRRERERVQAVPAHIQQLNLRVQAGVKEAWQTYAPAALRRRRGAGQGGQGEGDPALVDLQDLDPSSSAAGAAEGGAAGGGGVGGAGATLKALVDRPGPLGIDDACKLARGLRLCCAQKGAKRLAKALRDEAGVWTLVQAHIAGASDPSGRGGLQAGQGQGQGGGSPEGAAGQPQALLVHTPAVADIEAWGEALARLSSGAEGKASSSSSGSGSGDAGVAAVGRVVSRKRPLPSPSPSPSSTPAPVAAGASIVPLQVPGEVSQQLVVGPGLSIPGPALTCPYYAARALATPDPLALLSQSEKDAAHTPGPGPGPGTGLGTGMGDSLGYDMMEEEGGEEEGAATPPPLPCPPVDWLQPTVHGATLTLVPYNYLVEPGLRTALQIDLTGCILVVDEGHNLEDACREAASGSWSLGELRAAHRDLCRVERYLGSHNEAGPAHAALRALLYRVSEWLGETVGHMSLPAPAPLESMQAWVARTAREAEARERRGGQGQRGIQDYRGYSYEGGGGGGEEDPAPPSAPSSYLPFAAVSSHGQAPPPTPYPTPSYTTCAAFLWPADPPVLLPPDLPPLSLPPPIEERPLYPEPGTTLPHPGPAQAGVGGGGSAASSGGAAGAVVVPSDLHGCGPAAALANGGNSEGAGGVPLYWDGRAAEAILARRGLGLATYASLHEALGQVEAWHKKVQDEIGLGEEDARDGEEGEGRGEGEGEGGRGRLRLACATSTLSTLRSLLGTVSFFLSPRPGCGPDRAAAGDGLLPPYAQALLGKLGPRYSSDYRMGIVAGRAVPGYGSRPWGPGGMEQGGAGEEGWEGGLDHRLALWCMTAIPAFADAASQSRSIVVTSGTLAPLSGMRASLGVTFAREVVAPPAVKVGAQVWAGVVGRGVRPGAMALVRHVVRVQDLPRLQVTEGEGAHPHPHPHPATHSSSSTSSSSSSAWPWSTVRFDGSAQELLAGYRAWAGAPPSSTGSSGSSSEGEREGVFPAPALAWLGPPSAHPSSLHSVHLDGSYRGTGGALGRQGAGAGAGEGEAEGGHTGSGGGGVGGEEGSSAARAVRLAYIDALGSTLLHTATCTPGGMLAFFPSYSLLKECVARWQEAGCKVALLVQQGQGEGEGAREGGGYRFAGYRNLWEALCMVKALFVESSKGAAGTAPAPHQPAQPAQPAQGVARTGGGERRDAFRSLGMRSHHPTSAPAPTPTPTPTHGQGGDEFTATLQAYRDAVDRSLPSAGHCLGGGQARALHARMAAVEAVAGSAWGKRMVAPLPPTARPQAGGASAAAAASAGGGGSLAGWLVDRAPLPLPVPVPAGAGGGKRARHEAAVSMAKSSDTEAGKGGGGGAAGRRAKAQRGAWKKGIPRPSHALALRLYGGEEGAAAVLGPLPEGERHPRLLNDARIAGPGGTMVVGGGAAAPAPASAPAPPSSSSSSSSSPALSALHVPPCPFPLPPSLLAPLPSEQGEREGEGKGKEVWPATSPSALAAALPLPLPQPQPMRAIHYTALAGASLTGALFLGVTRARAAEGIDFPDSSARTVVAIGLPMPNARDPLITMKRAFQTGRVREEQGAEREAGEAARQTGRMAFARDIAAGARMGSGGIHAPPSPSPSPSPSPPSASPRLPTGPHSVNGNVWYTQGSQRALNQAIGRVIRHRHDYGAVVLLDARYGRAGVWAGLPSWLRPAVRVGVGAGAGAGEGAGASLGYDEVVRGWEAKVAEAEAAASAARRVGGAGPRADASPGEPPAAPGLGLGAMQGQLRSFFHHLDWHPPALTEGAGPGSVPLGNATLPHVPCSACACACELCAAYCAPLPAPAVNLQAYRQGGLLAGAAAAVLAGGEGQGQGVGVVGVRVAGSDGEAFSALARLEEEDEEEGEGEDGCAPLLLHPPTPPPPAPAALPRRLSAGPGSSLSSSSLTLPTHPPGPGAGAGAGAGGGLYDTMEGSSGSEGEPEEEEEEEGGDTLPVGGSTTASTRLLLAQEEGEEGDEEEEEEGQHTSALDDSNIAEV